MVGEKVLRLEERLGYVHKGIERRFTEMSILDGHRLAARVSGDSGVAYSWAYCEALERMAAIAVPGRGLMLRALALELERIGNHLGDLGALGNDGGFAFGFAQFSRLKELLLRATEQALGQRYLLDFVVPGGTHRDLALDGAAMLGRCLDGIETEAQVLLIALVAAALAAAAKALLARSGNDAYAVMILFGWSTALIAAANSVHGDDLSRALIQGQLYFTGLPHLEGLAGLVLLTAAILPWISRRLLVGRFFPDLFRANGLAKPHHDLVFDLLVAVTLAFAATAIGVFAAFALVFIPPWIAFRFAPGWKKTLIGSVAIAVVCYLIAFAAAILLDQPFGPVLVAVLLVAALGRLLRRHH